MTAEIPLTFLAFRKSAPLEKLPLSSELLIAGKDLHTEPGNFAASINAAAHLAHGEFLVVLSPEIVWISEELSKSLNSSAKDHPNGVFYYTDYFIRNANGAEERVCVYDDMGDITEREDWGPLWAIRVDRLRAAAGLDEQNPLAAFYDLLLKMQELGERVRIPTPLATIAAAPSSGEEALKSKLYFPGRGKLGGFSYLFMDPQHERQTETVFYEALKRRGAWLEGEYNTVPPRVESKSPLVSVITPVYNRANFIGDAITSVQKNSFADWEYVIVDNGSTDGTRDVVRRFAAADSRIRLIENDRNIIALSLNIALRHARGKYIAQLDSDDEYLPHTLESMVTALETHPTWALAISYYELMDEAGHSLPEFGIIKHLEYNRNNILRVDGAGALRCWHRSVIEEMGGFDERDFANYGEDYDLVLKVSEKYEVGRVHEVCYCYRRHEGNTDMLRDPRMKLRNKTLARLRALERRRKQNQGLV
ncbi:MAG: glycosyltransferase [bacterium]